MIKQHNSTTEIKHLIILIITIILAVSYAQISLAQSNITIQKYGASYNQGANIYNTTGVSSSNIDIVKYQLTYSFFSGASDANPTVCSCSTKTDRILIQNTGSFGADFTLTTNLPQYISVPKGIIHLEKGESAYVDLLISAACEVTDSQTYTITIKSNLGREQVITRPLTINKCQSINASLYADNTEIHPCQPVEYNITVQNPAPFDEKYLVSPTTFKESFDNKAYELNIPAGQTGIADFKLNLSCSIYGDKKIDFQVISENNNLQATLSHNLKIDQNYSFETKVSEHLEACTEEKKIIPVLINNTSPIYNEYHLELDGAPLFIALQTSYIDLNPGEEKSVNLEINPKTGNEKVYKFTLVVKTAKGDSVSTQPLELNVKDCYELSLQPKFDTPKDICSGKNEYVLTVKNTGETSESINLWTHGSKYASLNETNIDLNSGELKDVTVYVTPTDDMNKKSFSFAVQANLNGKSVSKTWSTKDLKFTTYNQYSCTYPKLSTKTINSRYNATGAIVKITNQGLTQTNYNLSIEGSSWLSLSTKSITVAPKETKDVFIKYYSDNSTVKSEYYASLNLKADNGIVYKEPLKITLSNTPFLEKVYNFLTATVCRSVSTILLILILIALILFIINISKKSSTYHYRGQKMVMLVGAGLIILAVLGILIFFGVPKSYYPPINSTQNATHHTFYEDSTFKLDLSSHFKDPDNDTLRYSVDSMPKDMSVKIDGKTAIITPNHNWYGTEDLVIKATDTAGVSVLSPMISLEVLNVLEYTPVQIYDMYCHYVALILFIVLIILILVTPFGRRLVKGGKVVVTGIKKESGYLYFVDKEGDVARAPMARSKKKPKKKPKQEKVGKVQATSSKFAKKTTKKTSKKK